MTLKQSLGVIGAPIAHSLSPLLHEFIIRQYDLPFTYSAYHVEKESLAEAVYGAQALGFRGLNVTVPYKKDVMSLLDEIDEFALKVGAVNTILFSEGRITGYNTDVFGFLHSLAVENVSLSDRDVVLLGAGGAARAIVLAAKKGGARSVMIYNRTYEKAAALAEKMGCVAVSQDYFTAIPDHAVIINTTSVGMHPNVNASPLPQTLFRADCLYIDIVYNPQNTLFLQYATHAGAQTVGGIGMLILQGILAMEIWSGKSIDLQQNFGALQDLLRRALGAQ
ncbi:MAG: shikimate dehydrogenase [Deferribacteres bacterium]|nr:shikimate dehydrogenase [candidate division KSB1 bacterium]MCB9501820.1 shikimate dehydrogenase [Deferribacteres bacterium]